MVDYNISHSVRNVCLCGFCHKMFVQHSEFNSG